jgi:hypothetical protein
MTSPRVTVSLRNRLPHWARNTLMAPAIVGRQLAVPGARRPEGDWPGHHASGAGGLCSS